MRRWTMAIVTVMCVVMASSMGAGAVPAPPAPAPGVEVITNGGFETGDFTGWSATTTLVTPYCSSWAIDAHCGGIVGPYAGSHMAGNGFDGSGGQFVLSQVVTLAAGTATLTWFDSAWASYSGTQRTLEVQVRNASGTTVLGIPYTYTLPFSASTGWVSHTVDLSAYTGQTIQLAFVQTVPENFTGPAGFGIDDISLHVLADRKARAGYCSVAGNTSPGGAALSPGTFLNLTDGQADGDAHYKGATPAYYYQGMGISCDVLPGYTKTGEMVGYWGHGDPGGYTYMAKN